MEHLSFKLYITENITISGTIIYRPPGPHTIFHDTIKDFAIPLNLDASNYLLLKTTQDSNLQLEDHSATNSRALIEDFGTLGLTQRKKGPTHVAGHHLSW